MRRSCESWITEEARTAYCSRLYCSEYTVPPFHAAIGSVGSLLRVGSIVALSVSRFVSVYVVSISSYQWYVSYVPCYCFVHCCVALFAQSTK